MIIRLPSVQSLLLNLEAGGHPLGPATGFLARRHGRTFLVTNWHVLTGRDQITGRYLRDDGATPDAVAIWHNLAGALGTWHEVREPLIDDQGRPLWLEHPTGGSRIDVVALPLTNVANSDLYPYELSVDQRSGPEVHWGVASPLSIIGFPFRLSGAGRFAIWLKGWVASEPDADYDNLPLFLIDARTRQGQSGAPVIFFDDGSGTLSFKNGSVIAGTGQETVELVGVYSGRINEQSDLGRVWKRRTVLEVLDGSRPAEVLYLQCPTGHRFRSPIQVDRLTLDSGSFTASGQRCLTCGVEVPLQSGSGIFTYD